MENESIFCAVPTYGESAHASAMANATNLMQGRGIIATAAISATPFCFNTLWCQALNNRKQFTHFLMMHSDVVPQGDFVGEMMDEMKFMGADVLSCVIPIKTANGLTSTGFTLPGDEWKVQRFTLKELERFPQSFTFPELVVNTGLMLVDLRKPWVEKVCFKYQDRIAKDAKGMFVPEFMPEDWQFSIDARKLGAQIVVTKRIKVSHIGSASFNNWERYGLDTDPRYNLKWENK